MAHSMIRKKEKSLQLQGIIKGYRKYKLCILVSEDSSFVGNPVETKTTIYPVKQRLEKSNITEDSLIF